MGQAIPIYVINLDRRTDRRNDIAKRMDQLGLAWTRVPAVDAGNPGDCIYGRAVADVRGGGTAERIARARTASHFRLWDRFLDQGGEYALVLEDDLTLSDQLSAYANTRTWIPGDADLVKIEKYHPGNMRVLMGPPKGKGPDGRRLHRLYSRQAGAGGYVIRRSTAEACREHRSGLSLSVDQYLFDFGMSWRARKMVCYFLQPALVTQFQLAGQWAEPDHRVALKSTLQNALSAAASAPRALRHMLADGARMRDVRWQNHANTDD
jgi:glycosyl transferase family 25